ncbi:MAG TPA: OmpH family outer membrane protein [Caulobacteraceae bacterium]|nr:OmpH family outer membrane protein [Caulobacteraceae bacterium]
MKTLPRIVAGVAAMTLLGDASLAFAQAKPAAPAPKAAAPTARPAAAPAAPAAARMTLSATTPGVCILSRDAILGASTVGKYVQTRLGQLQNQANAELTGEQSSIQTAAKDLEAKKATLAPAAYQQQGAALQQRAEALQEKAQLRDRELQATEQKAYSRVLLEATPLVETEAKSKNCSVLLDAQAVMAVNDSMNLTQGVITALNGKFTQFDFDRERLDNQPAAQQR